MRTRSLRRRDAAALLSIAAVVTAGTVATVGATAHAAVTACQVDYEVQNQWPDGFTGGVTITNLGNEPIDGWELTWSFTAGQQINNGWNGTFSQNGAQVTVTNAGWNSLLPPGARTRLGFNATWNNSENPVPASFALDGVICTGDAPPSTPPPSTPPPSSPPPSTPPPTTPPPAGECGSGSFHAEVTGSGGSYTATNGGSVVGGGSYLQAINAAINSLAPGRTSQQRVVVNASGSIGAAAIRLPSHTSFEVCGTMNVGNLGGRGAIEALNATNVSIPHLTMTGNPYFGLRFYGMDGLHLGQIRLELNGGLGVRFERDFPGSTNVTMDDIFVSGTGNHGVETWNVDGLTIGSVVARDTAFAGLLLNNTRYAEIGLVDGDNVATGTGYAVFRTANRNGRIGNDYPTNIHVGQVIARGGGRGVFCVSESGGLVIDRVDLAGTGNNSILIENCYNVSINGGRIDGGGELRVAARDEFANTRDVWVRDLTVANTGVRESPCGININWINLQLINTSDNTC